METATKPVCVIAHNGLKYDYRLLKAELDRAGIGRQGRIPAHVYFLDSYLMALDLEYRYFDQIRSQVNDIDWARCKCSQNFSTKVLVLPIKDMKMSFLLWDA